MAKDPPVRRTPSEGEVWSPGSKYWRNRAEQARSIGAKVRDPTVQATMEGIAQMYDNLADNAEQDEGDTSLRSSISNAGARRSQGCAAGHHSNSSSFNWSCTRTIGTDRISPIDRQLSRWISIPPTANAIKSTVRELRVYRRAAGPCRHRPRRGPSCRSCRGA